LLDGEMEIGVCRDDSHEGPKVRKTITTAYKKSLVCGWLFTGYQEGGQGVGLFALGGGAQVCGRETKKKKNKQHLLSWTNRVPGTNNRKKKLEYNDHGENTDGENTLLKTSGKGNAGPTDPCSHSKKSVVREYTQHEENERNKTTTQHNRWGEELLNPHRIPC